MTSSPSSTWVPSAAGAPLIVTRPSSIKRVGLAPRARAALAQVLVEPHVGADPTSGAALPWCALRLLLVTPPMTQLNTPYPATAYLTGFLRQHAARLGLEVAQADAAIELFLRVFSPGRPRSASSPSSRARDADADGDPPASIAHFLAHGATLRRHGRRGRARSCRAAIPGSRCASSAASCLPEGPRFAAIDRARRGRRRSARVGVRRPRHRRSREAPREPLHRRSRRRDPRRHRIPTSSCRATASGSPRARRRSIRCATRSRASRRCRHDARRARRASCRAHIAPTSSASPRRSPATSTARSASRARSRRSRRPRASSLGGGYVNTELRELTDPRVFDYVDFITLDDGERPMLALLEHLRDPTHAAAAHVRPTRRRGRARHRRRAARHPAARRRHADLRGPAARSLPVAVRDAQPDAPAVVRRPLEQAHDRARLLLEAVHVLRRHARLHRALRPRAGGSARRSDRGADRRDRADRLSLRRRGRAARRRCARSPSG